MAGGGRWWVAAWGGLLLSCLPAWAAAEASRDPPLRVGIYQNAPKLFLAEDGSAQGFFPLLVDELAAGLGREVSYSACEWNDCLAALAAGEIDMLPDVAHSPERADSLRFGHEAALHAVSYLYARPGFEAQRFEQVDGSRLAVVTGSIQADHMRDLMRRRQWTLELVKVPDMRSVLAAVADERADFGIVNDYFGRAEAPGFGLQRTRFVLQPTPLFFAFRPDIDPAFVARMDAELARLKAAPDSLYYEAYRRWMLSPAETALPPWVHWSGLLGTLGLLLAALAAWIYRRRAQGSAVALRLSRERLATIAETLDLGVWEWAPGVGGLRCDVAMLRLLGLPVDQSIDDFEAILQRVHEADRPKLRAGLERVLAAGEPLDTEFRIVKEDAGEASVDWRHMEVLARAGEEAGSAFGIMVDVTRMRALESQLVQTQKMEALGALTGGIAHDFNNMLMVIASNLELAAELDSDPELAGLLHDARQATTRGAELTRRLLTFSRRQALQAERIDLNDQLRRSTTLLNRIIPESVRIEVRLAAEPAWALVDAGQLENALVNLAINARDAMPDGGQLSLECDSVELSAGRTAVTLAAGRYHRILVADTGEGMTAEVREHAMDPFFTTKQGGQGTGLGLAMVFGFVRQSGGDLLIDSEPGRGTRVALYFPALDGGAEVEAEHAPATSLAGQGLRVLLVEDDPGVRRMAERLLGTLGMHCRSAVDGHEAMAEMEADPQVDLLLSDVVMPGGMSGIELLTELRTRWPSLPAILMSGYSAERELSGLDLPAGTAWLAKPFTRSELMAAVEAVRAAPAGKH